MKSGTGWTSECGKETIMRTVERFSLVTINSNGKSKEWHKWNNNNIETCLFKSTLKTLYMLLIVCRPLMHICLLLMQTLEIHNCCSKQILVVRIVGKT